MQRSAGHGSAVLVRAATRRVVCETGHRVHDDGHLASGARFRCACGQESTPMPAYDRPGTIPAAVILHGRCHVAWQLTHCVYSDRWSSPLPQPVRLAHASGIPQGPTLAAAGA